MTLRASKRADNSEPNLPLVIMHLCIALWIRQQTFLLVYKSLVYRIKKIYHVSP